MEEEEASVNEEYVEEFEEDLDAEVEAELEEEEEETLPDLTEELPEPEEVVLGLQDDDESHRVVKIQPPEERITSEIIQLSEMVEAIGIRASQIEAGAEVFTDVTGLSDPILMATKEFLDHMSPLILERHLKVGKRESVVEQWPVRFMKLPVSNEGIQQFTDKRISSLTKGG